VGQTDPSRFVRVFIQHQDELLRYVLPLVGCLADAQDVLQETATALWKKFDEYDPEQPFLPWARQFARYEVLMHRRRKRRFVFLSEELIELLAERSSQRESLVQRRRQALESCLKQLPEADRVLIDQRYASAEVTIQQIAEHSNQTANALYKALERIRRQLLDCIQRRLLSEGA